MIISVVSFVLSTFLSFRTMDLIEWSRDRKLVWTDFRGTPDPLSTDAALTNSSINIEFGYNTSGFNYSIKCRFDTDRSWARIRNDYILAHEQGHFDLAEVYARKLNKALKKYTFNKKTVAADINTIYDSIIRAHHGMQKEYDIETDHSRNPIKQQEWKNKIDSLLVANVKWSNYK